MHDETTTQKFSHTVEPGLKPLRGYWLFEEKELFDLKIINDRGTTTEQSPL